MKRQLNAAVIVAMSAMAPFALKAEKFEAKPIGVLHMDAATYMGNLHSEFTTGVALPEIRIGADAKYGDWKVRILVGFANNKVAAKDVYVQYNLDSHNYFRAGHFVHQYGYQNSTAAYDKPTMVAPGPETAFNAPQRLGIGYVHADSLFMATASVYTPDDMLNNALGSGEGKINRQSFGLKSRLAYHPFTDSDKLIGQIGLSGLFETPRSNIDKGGVEYENYFGFSLPFPTKVNSVSADNVSLSGCRNRWQISPDLLLAHGRVALESQYYYTRVNMLYGMKHYHAQGFYVNARGILIGDGYGFAPSSAGLATPKPGSLEAILTYDYTDMAETNYGLQSRPVHNMALVLNYYINKYLTARLYGGCTHIPAQEQMSPSKNLGVIQARMQVIF